MALGSSPRADGKGASASAPAPNSVLFEFVVLGGSVKVTALDPVSGAEAVVVGPSGAAQADLRRLALRKLQTVLARAKA
jgi:hypothetical protein